MVLPVIAPPALNIGGFSFGVSLGCNLGDSLLGWCRSCRCLSLCPGVLGVVADEVWHHSSLCSFGKHFVTTQHFQPLIQSAQCSILTNAIDDHGVECKNSALYVAFMTKSKKVFHKICFIDFMINFAVNHSVDRRKCSAIMAARPGRTRRWGRAVMVIAGILPH